MEGWNRGGYTVDGEPVYSAVPHPRCVAAGTCQGSFLGDRIDSDEHGFLYGPGDALAHPIHYGEAVKFDGMTCGVGMVIDQEWALKCSLFLSPKFLPHLQINSIVHPG